jgi:hypothetical protein
MVKFSLEDPNKILRVGTKLNIHADDRQFDLDQHIAGAARGDIETLVYSKHIFLFLLNQILGVSRHSHMNTGNASNPMQSNSNQ